MGHWRSALELRPAAGRQPSARSVRRHEIQLKSFLKMTVFVAGLMSLAIVVLLGYLYLSYLDETAVTGSAYGYTIGQSKRESYAVATDQFAAREISGIHIMEPFQTFDPIAPSFAAIESSDRWTIFPAERDDFFDTIELHFQGGKLTKVHRHRQRFELP